MKTGPRLKNETRNHDRTEKIKHYSAVFFLKHEIHNSFIKKKMAMITAQVTNTAIVAFPHSVVVIVVEI